MRRRKRLIQNVGRWAFNFGLRLAQGKNAAKAEKLGVRFGRILYRVSAKQRKRAFANLKMVFPEMTDLQRRELVHKVFEHFGLGTMDFLRTEQRPNEEVLANMEVEGFEHLENALKGGKGVFIITAHFGNWERLAQYLSARGITLHAVQRDLDDKELNQTVSRIRAAAGMGVLSRGNAVRSILKALKANQVVGLLPDQNSEEAFVPFFGKPAGTTLGPAVLHLRTKAPLVPVFCARIGVGKYRTVVRPPLTPVHGIEDEQLALTQAVNNAIEEMVRQYPEQWLWIHDRWKSARKRGLL